jgi:hypothetical protein
MAVGDLKKKIQSRVDSEDFDALRKASVLTLSDRWVNCNCGLSLSRDHNAALNILKRAGHARWGLTWPVAASVP